MKRPISVTIIAWFFIIVGTAGFIHHLPEVTVHDFFVDDAVWILIVRLLAVAGGIMALRGIDIGRWLLILWMAYHVVVSFFIPFQDSLYMP